MFFFLFIKQSQRFVICITIGRTMFKLKLTLLYYNNKTYKLKIKFITENH